MSSGSQYWDKVVYSPNFSSITNNLPGNIVKKGFSTTTNVGVSFLDSSSTPNPPVVTTMGYFNTSSYLDVVGDFTSVFSGNFTIECWFFPLNVTNITCLFGGIVNQFALTIANGQIYADKYGVGTLLPKVTISINNWYKIAITRSSDTFNLYLNNILVSSATNAVSFISSSFYRIGGFTNNDNTKFNGYIADLLLTKEAKTVFSPLSMPSMKYLGTISGTLVQNSLIKDWVVTGISSSGATCQTTTNTSEWVLKCPTIEPYLITTTPVLEGYWKANINILTGYRIVPSNPDINSYLYECITSGTTGTTEPLWGSSIITDGTVVWKLLSKLGSTNSLVARIPI